MMRSWAFRLGLLALLTPLAAGCNGESSVHGTVTYEGEPIEAGQVLFLPADGKGPSAGGTIVRGKYAIDNLTPGAKTVQIVATREATAPVTSLDDIVARGPKGPAAANPPSNLVPSNAEGNNASVEIKPGKNVLDFNLRKPARARGKAGA
jgi:hypothetical protein